MKKTKAAASSSVVDHRTPSSGGAGSKSSAPLEKTRADLGGNTPRSSKSTTGGGAGGGSQTRAQVLNKTTFLSKSQDNLASQLRRKAVAAALKGANNKENLSGGGSLSSSSSAVASREKTVAYSGAASSSSATTSAPGPAARSTSCPGVSGSAGSSSSSTASSGKHVSSKSGSGSAAGNAASSLMPSVRSAGAPSSSSSSTSGGGGGSGDPGATPIKRAQSAQNIDKTSSGSSSGATPTGGNKSGSGAVKRASSTQNISGGKSGTKVRISAPANIMAYNAELLANFEKEKKALERRISELIQIAEVRKTEIEKFKFEVKNLRECPTEEFEVLRNENRLLKDRLQELGVTVEQFTDTEKLCLLQQQTDSLRGGGGVGGCTGGDVSSLRTIDSELGLSVGDLSSCITPEHPSSLSLDNGNWDKQSNKSSDAMSEVSVACLQDRIQQMEETHYSTNEELQATLQELADLQYSVNELTSQNERLGDERSVLLESLCAQTEKLENCRMQIEHLKVLLVSESEGAERSENERQLVALIKSAAEEREEFLLKQCELSNALAAHENRNSELQDVVSALRDKAQILEMKNESLTADKRALDTQVAELKETTAKEQIELQHCRTLLENERSKVAELEQCHKATGKSDLEELLDNTRQEKDKVEERLANVQEELAVSQNEVSKLQEQVSSLEEDLKVSKNNAKTQVSDLEYRLGQVGGEKTDLEQEMESLRDHIDQLQQDCDGYLEEKKQHAAQLAELQAELKTKKEEVHALENEQHVERDKFRMEQEEWRQFQQDLQTAVVIANDIKTETQEDMENLRSENSMLVKKNCLLVEELTRSHAELEQLRQLKDRHEIRGRVITNVDRELSALRHGRKLSDPWGPASGGVGGVSGVGGVGGAGSVTSLSVKNLIASIEQQVKSNCTPPLSPSAAAAAAVAAASRESSRRNSVDSALSVSGISLKGDSPTKTSPTENRRASMPADAASSSSASSAASSAGAAASPLGYKSGLVKKPTELAASDVSSSSVAAVGVVTSPVGAMTSSPTSRGLGASHRHALTDIIYETAPPVTDDAKVSPPGGAGSRGDTPDGGGKKPLTSILSKTSLRKPATGDVEKPPLSTIALKSDPLANLSKNMGGSKRNALLKWCQNKTHTYSNIDITNFSSSWNDGMAFCAILHSYLPDKIPYRELSTQDKRRNFTLAFKAAESVGIPATLNINDMVSIERPDWQAVMAYVTAIYKHFEVDAR